MNDYQSLVYTYEPRTWHLKPTKIRAVICYKDKNWFSFYRILWAFKDAAPVAITKSETTFAIVSYLSNLSTSKLQMTTLNENFLFNFKKLAKFSYEIMAGVVQISTKPSQVPQASTDFIKQSHLFSWRLTVASFFRTLLSYGWFYLLFYQVLLSVTGPSRAETDVTQFSASFIEFGPSFEWTF